MLTNFARQATIDQAVPTDSSRIRSNGPAASFTSTQRSLARKSISPTAAPPANWLC